MKKLLFLVLLVLLFSCEHQHCGKCMVIYEPLIRQPATFSVCSDAEFDYWNGREWVEPDGINTYQVKVICERNKY